jgi:hypothetical protein
LLLAVVFIGVTCFMLGRRQRNDERNPPPSERVPTFTMTNPMYTDGDALAPSEVYDNSSSPVPQAEQGTQPPPTVYATTVPGAAPQRPNHTDGYYEEPDAPDYEHPVPVNSHHTVMYDTHSSRTTRNTVKLDPNLYVSET